MEDAPLLKILKMVESRALTADEALKLIQIQAIPPPEAPAEKLLHVVIYEPPAAPQPKMELNLPFQFAENVMSMIPGGTPVALDLGGQRVEISQLIQQLKAGLSGQLAEIHLPERQQRILISVKIG